MSPANHVRSIVRCFHLDNPFLVHILWGSVYKTLIAKMNYVISKRAFSPTWPSSMQIYWNKKKDNLTPTGLFWDTNMAAVTSCENLLYPLYPHTVHLQTQRRRWRCLRVNLGENPFRSSEVPTEFGQSGSDEPKSLIKAY